MRKTAKLIAGNLLVGTALFLLVELVLHFAIPKLKPGYSRFERTYPGQYSDFAFSGENWPRQEPDVGWVCNGSAIMNANSRLYRSNVVYRINAQGYRDEKDFDVVEPGGKRLRLMVLGESFLFGRYVTQDETICAHMERQMESRADVFNLAIPGWGIDQMWLAYRKYVDRIRPQIVVLFFIDEDVERVYQAFRRREGMGKPSFDVENGQLVRREGGKPGLGMRLVNRSYLLSAIHGQVAKLKSLRIARVVVGKLADEVKGRNQTLVVVRCPLLADLQRGQKVPRYDLRGVVESHGAFYFDLADRMQGLSPDDWETMYLRGDMHLSPEGCRFAAEFIAERIPVAPKTNMSP